MCVCIFAYICLYAYMCIFCFMYLCIYMFIRVYVNTYICIYVYMSGGHSFAVRGQVGIVSRGVVLVAACGSSWAQAPGWEQVQWGAALTLGEGRWARRCCESKWAQPGRGH